MSMNPGPRVSRIHGLLIVLLGGCGAAEFTEADRGKTRIVDVGSTFTVSLPSGPDWAPPSLKGNCVLFLDKDCADSMDATLFQFKASLEGESEIVIRAQPSWGEDRDFSMRVLVIDRGEDADETSPFDNDWRDRWDRWGRGRDD
jgi:hypothetical protein